MASLCYYLRLRYLDQIISFDVALKRNWYKHTFTIKVPNVNSISSFIFEALIRLRVLRSPQDGIVNRSLPPEDQDRGAATMIADAIPLARKPHGESGPGINIWD